MKTKTLLELLTLTSSLYFIAKDTQLIDRFNELSGKGKDSINSFISETQFDQDGNEMEFIDKIILKTNQAKKELEEKIEELIVSFYKKANIAHLDEVRALNEKIEKLNQEVALLEARVNHIEQKK